MVITSMGFGVAKLVWYYKKLQRKGLLDPPIDILEGKLTVSQERCDPKAVFRIVKPTHIQLNLITQLSGIKDKLSLCFFNFNFRFSKARRARWYLTNGRTTSRKESIHKSTSKTAFEKGKNIVWWPFRQRTRAGALDMMLYSFSLRTFCRLPHVLCRL